MKQNWMSKLIKKADHALLVIFVVCILLGAAGVILQLLIHGRIGQGHIVD